MRAISGHHLPGIAASSSARDFLNCAGLEWSGDSVPVISCLVDQRLPSSCRAVLMLAAIGWAILGRRDVGLRVFMSSVPCLPYLNPDCSFHPDSGFACYHCSNLGIRLCRARLDMIQMRLERSSKLSHLKLSPYTASGQRWNVVIRPCPCPSCPLQRGVALREWGIPGKQPPLMVA